MKPTASNFRLAALACLFVLAAAFTTAARAGDPETVFLNPPDSAKPLVYWFWMGRNITAEGITGDLETLKAAGFGGTTMCNLGDCCTPWPYEIGHGLNPDMVPYVSESWWKLVRHAAAESRRLGLDFGMHNCPGYESNGGPWITPELVHAGNLLHANRGGRDPEQGRMSQSRGPPSILARTCRFPFTTPTTAGSKSRRSPPARPTIATSPCWHCPPTGVVPKEKVVDLTGAWPPTARSTGKSPRASGSIYRFGHTTMGTLIQPAIWKATGLECDKMNPEAVAFHMDHVIAEIRKHLGDLVGHGLNYLWFDSYEAGTPSWTPKMREEFKTRRGYDLTPFLPTWAHREIGSAAESRKFKEDFQRTIFDLYRDVNFEVSSQKAHAAGLRIQSEPYGGPWNIAEVVPKFDQVAGEFWNQGGQYGPLCVAEVVAGTRLAGQNMVNAEAFTAAPDMSHWNETPESDQALGRRRLLRRRQPPDAAPLHPRTVERPLQAGRGDGPVGHAFRPHANVVGTGQGLGPIHAALPGAVAMGQDRRGAGRLRRHRPRRSADQEHSPHATARATSSSWPIWLASPARPSALLPLPASSPNSGTRSRLPCAICRSSK